MVNRTLLANGDSWTYGSELIDPKFNLTDPIARMRKTYDSDNDHYRIPNIWPTHLGELLGVDNVVNISFNSRSNDSIYDSTTSWIIENYIAKGESTDGLTAVIGWTSLERKNIFIDDDKGPLLITMWPNFANSDIYNEQSAKDVFKNYVVYQFIEQEYIKRFVEQNYNLKLFFEKYDIEYYVFNAFFHTTQHAGAAFFKDISVSEKLKKWADVKLHPASWQDPNFDFAHIIRNLTFAWDTIDSDTFILKDVGTFRSYVTERVTNAMHLMHPTEESHRVWAARLATHILTTRDKTHNV